MALQEDDLISCSSLALETVTTAEPFTGQIPSRVAAAIQYPYGINSTRYIAGTAVKPKSVAVCVDTTSKNAEVEVDTTAPYLAGFAIGWCTWIFGLLLLFFSGQGKRPAALRRGVVIGAIAVTAPFIVMIVLFAIVARRWNQFLGKFPLDLLGLFGGKAIV